MEAFGRYLALILAVILIFLFPLQYIAQSQSETIDDVVCTHASEFTDTAKQQGYITRDMYEDLVYKLDQIGEFYDITIEASHPVSGKEIADATVGEEMPKLSMENVSYTKSGSPVVSDNNNILSSFATHTHTADCYPLTLHVCNGTDCVYSGTSIVVAVGYNGFYYSTNGTTWSKGTASNAVMGVVKDVTYGNGKFVAVGYGRAWYSTDGKNWTDVSLTTYVNLDQVAYGNGVFVATGYDSWNTKTNIWYSTDGITWKTVYTNGLTVPPYYSDVAFINDVNKRFMAIRGAGIIETYIWDGTSLRYCDGGSYFGYVSLQKLFTVNKNIAFVANVTAYMSQLMGSYIYNSQTGLPRSSYGVFAYGGGKYMDLISADVYTATEQPSSYNNTWSKVGTFPTANTTALTYYYDKFIGSGYASGTTFNEGIIASSTNGVSWTQTSIGSRIYALACNVDGGSGVPDKGTCIKIGKYYDSTVNTEGAYYSGDTPVSPICNQVVTSITATNPAQSIAQGGSIITTATATYLDGHTGTVNCTVSGFNANSIGTQTVTLTYSGLISNAKTTGTKTCTTTVTVTSTRYPTSLTVTPSATTIYNGASEPTYTVVVAYNDMTSKTLTSAQYTKTGWTTGLGTKSVVFSYTENARTVTKTITITVLPNLTSITVTPASQTIKRYSNPVFTVRAYYENSTNKIISGGYSVSGLNINSLGTQTATISYTENFITKTASVTVIITKLTTTCPICGTSYELDTNDLDRGCPVCAAKTVNILISPSIVSIYKGGKLPITVTAVYQNGKMAAVTGWTSNYDPNIIGIREVKVEYQGVSAFVTVETLPPKMICPVCGNPYSLNNDGTDPGCPICSKEVISIHITEDSVTVEKHQPLPLTVTAIYKDGHTATVTDWNVNFVTDTTGTFDVTVYYKSVNDHVMVKVTDEGYIICPYCDLEYDRSENPGGCPVCSKTIVGIEAHLRNGGTQVLYKSQLNLSIVLIYKDTHRMITYTGYTLSGYQADVIGEQLVTVYYNGLSTTLTVEVIAGPAKVTCPNGHEYYLNEDGSDPGCPYCVTTDKDKAIFYFEATYTSEIVAVLYEDGIYYLTEGDYLTVTVTQRDASIRSKLKKMFFGTNSGVTKKKYTFGGEV